MSEVKPVAKIVDASGHRCAIEWFDPEYRSDGTLLYSAEVVEELRESLEASQKENLVLSKRLEYIGSEINSANERAHGAEETFKRVAAHSEALQAENAEQAKRIAELESQIGWIDILDGEDAMYESILTRAKQSYMRHKYSIRGQQITRSDALETHIINAAFEFKESGVVHKSVQKGLE